LDGNQFAIFKRLRTTYGDPVSGFQVATHGEVIPASVCNLDRNTFGNFLIVNAHDKAAVLSQHDGIASTREITNSLCDLCKM
jgi:hypothetical protein